MKHAIDLLDKNKRYRLACGHNNAGGLNIYPFKTFVCLVCGYMADRVEEVEVEVEK